MAVIAYIGASPCVRVVAANGLREAITEVSGVSGRPHESADWKCCKASRYGRCPRSRCDLNDSLRSRQIAARFLRVALCDIRPMRCYGRTCAAVCKLREPSDDERCRLIASGLLLLSTPSSIASKIPRDIMIDCEDCLYTCGLHLFETP